MKLDDLRKKVDLVDERILVDLADRMNVVRKIKRLKAKQGLPIADKTRETQLLQNIMQKAKKLNLSADFVSRLFELIISESKKNQEKV